MKIPMQMGGVQTVATGITGVTAYKSGNVVTLMIALDSTTFTGSGWQAIGTLPQELKPITAIRFVGFDNTAASYADSSAVSCRLGSSGNLSIYYFGDKLTMAPHASVTYITN